MAGGFNFVVSNEDIKIRFSCPNHKKRIEEIISNLGLAESGAYEKKLSKFIIDEGQASFSFNDKIETNKELRHESVFFENTDYPLIIKGNKGKELDHIQFLINDRLVSGEKGKSSLTTEEGELFGSLNFKNQVGLTDFKVRYKVKGDNVEKVLKFTTEVLSYKLDYRSDLKSIISDIENEYALLSASFLKDTYLGMRTNSGESSPLVWWQIFKSCYEEIVRATRDIIERPKRRHRSIVRYERAERLRTLPRELENEYLLHKDNPAYLYRTEEMVLSHDTIENRFLKHAINEMARKFSDVKAHILTAMRLDNELKISDSLKEMEDELLQLQNNSFFRGVGLFKGFSQDSLVMKQAHGYKTILAKWIELQQGYELEEGIRKLEVKEISDLYEIWCFIKVKNIVQETLRDLKIEATPTTNGKVITNDFIPQLVYGGSVSFINTANIELASVSYNAEVQNKKSYIQGTNTLTTTQRPDIVLRLTKTEDSGMKYTYLFDAKYRIDDSKDKNGNDVPPEDAINQMHRYRDAIYYTENGSDKEHLKKEIIGGYVLFPGKIKKEALDYETGDYLYHQSNKQIGIGAFPLRPEHHEINLDGSLRINPDDSETALREQIHKWLEEENSREKLLDRAIPQKGLEYSDEPVSKGTYFIHSIDANVNPEKKLIEQGLGEGKTVISGYTAVKIGLNFERVKYFVPVMGHTVEGYYRIKELKAISADKEIESRLQFLIEKEKERKQKLKEKYKPKEIRFSGDDQPIRIAVTLGEYMKIKTPFIYGIPDAPKGNIITRHEFNEYRSGKKSKSDKSFFFFFNDGEKASD